MRTRRIGLGLRLAALAPCLLMLACQRSPRVAVVGPGGEQRAAVAVEIADSPAKQQIGLMFRKQLAPEAGMLFVFPAPSRREFWMRNTEIPLDMIFADRQGRVVGIVAGAQPLSETPLGVEADSQYVLEVNGGFCRRRGVKVGDRLQFADFPPRPSD